MTDILSNALIFATTALVWRHFDARMTWPRVLVFVVVSTAATIAVLRWL